MPPPYPTQADPRAESPINTGPMTRDEWIATHAIATLTNYQNGVDITNPFYSNAAFDARGLTRLDPSSAGVGGGSALDPFSYGALTQAAAFAFDHWNELTPEEQAGFLNPIGADGKPLPDIKYVDPSLAISSYGAESDRIRANAAANRDNAEAAAALMNAQSNAADVANRYAVGMAQVAADNARTGSQERIAKEDRAESARQFDRRLEEDVRQFDLNLGEERRQFNATMVFNLLQTGVELARRPVDWIAHQFYMANLQIPLSFVNMSAAANLFGAIPPSGPSAAGPVVGGPAAMDGDTELAQQAGAQAGFVSVAEAIAQNPGFAATAPQIGIDWASATTTAQTLEQTVPGGVAAVDQQLQQARAAELPSAVGDNPVVQQALVGSTQSQVVGPLAADGTDAGAPGGPAPGTEPVAPPAPTGAYGKPLTQARGTWYDVNAAGMDTSSGGMIPGGVSTVPQPGPSATSAPVASQAIAEPPPGSTANRGPYTGAATEAPAANPQPANSGAQQIASAANPQGELMIQTLAAQLGIDANTLRNVLPTNLMAGGYSAETIAQSPIVQALQQKADRLSGYRTAPTEQLGGERFANIGAFGIPLGIRSGQDINAGLLLKSNPDQQEMLQGAIEASGQYYPTAVAQSLRSSPVTQFGVGAFGRRRFN